MKKDFEKCYQDIDDDWEVMVLDKGSPPVLEEDDFVVKSGLNEFIMDYFKNKKSKPKKRKKKVEKRLSDLEENIYNELCYNPYIHNPPLPFPIIDESYARIGNNIPEHMLLGPLYPGFFFGIPKDYYGNGVYVGKPQEDDENILVVGGTGSGKTTAIAKPTLRKWKGSIFAIDIKGDLTRHKPNGRSTKILNLVGECGTHFTYDPFQILRQDGKNLFQNATELAQSIIPISLNCSENDGFWLKAAQKVLTATVLYCFAIGMSFIETMLTIQTTPFDKLISDIRSGGNPLAIMLVSEFPDGKDISDDKLSLYVNAELRSKTILFASDAQIVGAFAEGDNSIKWEDLKTHNVILRLDESKLGQWDNAIVLMLTQLIRSLERRPDKYSSEGQGYPPVLLILDEFPRLGRLDAIKNAVSTLRSRGVTVCLMIQSLAQLDDVYGQNVRRIIVDNCRHVAILNCIDVESQKYFSDMIGAIRVGKKSVSKTFNPYGQLASYSGQISEDREPIIYPHEFGLLDEEIILKTPGGFCRVNKLKQYLKKEI